MIGRIAFRLSLSAASLALMLAACSPGGVGSGGTGLAEGFVSGFGSLIVDGIAYDDSQARLQPETLDDQDALARPRIGERVRLRLREDGRIATIEIRSQLRGPITRAAYAMNGGQWIDALGLPVRIIENDTGGFPNTILEGFDSVEAISADDHVEVHGIWGVDAAGSTALHASRIARLAGPPEHYKISGRIDSVADGQLTLRGSQTIALASGASEGAWATGTEILAWVRRDDWLNASGAGAVPVARLGRAGPERASFGELRITATVGAAQIDPASGTMQVNGVEVFVPPALRTGLDALPQHASLVVSEGPDGRLIARSIERGADSSDRLGATLRLKTVLSWPEQITSTWALRDTAVQGFAEAIERAESCAGFAPGDSVFVSLSAERGRPGERPTVSVIECSGSVPDGAIHEGVGEVLAVEAGSDGSPAAVLIAQPAGKAPLRIELPAESALSPGTIQELVGQRVDVGFERQQGSAVLRELRAPRAAAKPPPRKGGEEETE